VAVLWQVFELDNEGNMKHTVLGLDLAAGQTPQYEVKPMELFGAYPTNDILHIPPHDDDGNSGPLLKAASRDPEHHFSLVGCTCAPAFQFEDFELANQAELLASHPKKAHDFIKFLTPE
jgi:predicted cupin superfamily sugar epimerase